MHRMRNRKFESIPLLRGVTCEPELSPIGLRRPSGHGPRPPEPNDMMHARELAVEIPEADGAQQIGGPGSDFTPGAVASPAAAENSPIPPLPIGSHRARAGYRLAEALSRPSTSILAVTIFVGQASIVKPLATAIFCAPFAV